MNPEVEVAKPMTISSAARAVVPAPANPASIANTASTSGDVLVVMILIPPRPSGDRQVFTTISAPPSSANNPASPAYATAAALLPHRNRPRAKCDKRNIDKLGGLVNDGRREGGRDAPPNRAPYVRPICGGTRPPDDALRQNAVTELNECQGCSTRLHL
jgi:hypothetical protein